MRTVFETQLDFSPNWAMLIISSTYILIGISLWKKRTETYKHFTQMISPALFLLFGVIGLIVFCGLCIYRQPAPALLSVISFLLFMPLIGFLDFKEPKALSEILKPKALFILSLIICVMTTFGACFLMHTIIENAQIQYFIHNTYQEGKSFVVEGEVEDFHPMPETLHDSESFSVNGIKFSYNNHKESYYYSKCAFDGGVITRNSQKVKIWYIETDDECRYIVRIDFP